LPDVMKPGQEATAQETATAWTTFSNWSRISQKCSFFKHS
jgi:hypothetical protein